MGSKKQSRNERGAYVLVRYCETQDQFHDPRKISASDPREGRAFFFFNREKSSGIVEAAKVYTVLFVRARERFPRRTNVTRVTRVSYTHGGSIVVEQQSDGGEYSSIPRSTTFSQV